MKPVAFDYARPTSLSQALAMLAGNTGAKVLAGRQTLGPMLNLRLAQPQARNPSSDQRPSRAPLGGDGLVECCRGKVRPIAAQL